MQRKYTSCGVGYWYFTIIALLWQENLVFFGLQTGMILPGFYFFTFCFLYQKNVGFFARENVCKFVPDFCRVFFTFLAWICQGHAADFLQLKKNILLLLIEPERFFDSFFIDFLYLKTILTIFFKKNFLFSQCDQILNPKLRKICFKKAQKAQETIREKTYFLLQILVFQGWFTFWTFGKKFL